MERETFPKLKPQAPETQVCVLYHWESVVVVAIESMPFLFIRIHMTSMQTVSAEVSFLNILHFLNESAFQRCYKSSLPMEQFV